jgi:hypothetical protein
MTLKIIRESRPLKCKGGYEFAKFVEVTMTAQKHSGLLTAPEFLKPIPIDFTLDAYFATEISSASVRAFRG